VVKHPGSLWGEIHKGTTGTVGTCLGVKGGGWLRLLLEMEGGSGKVKADETQNRGGGEGMG